jgi:sulfide:quinone oxidoreductase
MAAEQPLQVVIAGAGVAGLEAMMALRSLAGPRVEITLVAPTDEFVLRQLSTGEPFGLAAVRSYPLDGIVRDFGATHVHDSIAWIAARNQRVFLESGDELGYDALVLALGARAVPAWPHVPAFRGPRDVPMVRELIADVEAGNVGSIGFAVPAGVSWPFPLYELALLTASCAAGLDLAVFTPEPRPLDAFGSEASEEVAALLAAAGIRHVPGAAPEITRDLEVIVDGAGERFDRILTVPRLDGPAPRGVPCDDDGFLPVDSHGLVRHAKHIYAAGDGTDFPVKQGGIAAQQAVAVAEVIAKRAGAHVAPSPLRPILRGHLMANGSSRFLRGELHARDGGGSEASETPLWFPAGKVAGAHLGPYLASVDARPPARVGDGLRAATTWIEESPFGE